MQTTNKRKEINDFIASADSRLNASSEVYINVYHNHNHNHNAQKHKNTCGHYAEKNRQICERGHISIFLSESCPQQAKIVVICISSKKINHLFFISFPKLYILSLDITVLIQYWNVIIIYLSISSTTVQCYYIIIILCFV
jgi:hypothetical protein